MKKTFLMLFLIALIAGLNAQNSTNELKTTAIDSVELIKTNAEKWFKDVYVENYFKDPYSYRVVGLKAVPITNRDFFNLELEIAQHEIDTCSLSENDRSLETLATLKQQLLQGENDMKSSIEKIDSLTKESDKEFERKRLEIYQHFYKVRLSFAERIEVYQLAVNMKDEIEHILNNMTDEQANTLKYYDIRLDCYSKNSIGNEVLGRFSFPFDKNGLVIIGDNPNPVKQLN